MVVYGRAFTQVVALYAGAVTMLGLAKPSVRMNAALRWQPYWMMLVLLAYWSPMCFSVSRVGVPPVPASHRLEGQALPGSPKTVALTRLSSHCPTVDCPKASLPSPCPAPRRPTQHSP
jgi:hypothetical protein